MEVLQSIVLLLLIPLAQGSIRNSKYLGCYRDSTKDRVMVSPRQGTSVNMTLDLCREWCLEDTPASFFSTSFYHECYCGDVYDKHGPVNETVCDASCSGNKEQMCGGNSTLSVFTVCPPGYHGLRCDVTCGHCADMSRGCFRRNGSCISGGCEEGWTGHDCQRDIDECKGAVFGETCGIEYQCINTPGAYTCKCRDGFYHDLDTKTCADVDKLNMRITKTNEVVEFLSHQFTVWNSVLSSVVILIIIFLLIQAICRCCCGRSKASHDVHSTSEQMELKTVEDKLEVNVSDEEKLIEKKNSQYTEVAVYEAYHEIEPMIYDRQVNNPNYVECLQAYEELPQDRKQAYEELPQDLKQGYEKLPQDFNRENYERVTTDNEKGNEESNEANNEEGNEEANEEDNEGKPQIPRVNSKLYTSLLRVKIGEGGAQMS